jgi:predicted transglutaminase-like cysteine proteinase
MAMPRRSARRRFARGAAAVLLLLLLALAAPTAINEPFGLTSVAAPEGPLWQTWRRVQDEIGSELRIVARCRTEGELCTAPAAQHFIEIVDQGKGHDGLAKIGRINRAANLAIIAANTRARPDARRPWRSPLTTLALGIGDCKHYAVLKYAALSAAGVAPDDLRLVTVTIRSTSDYHAVVAVRASGGWHVLDNVSLAVVESRKLSGYVPMFSLDHRGVRRFVRPPGPVAALGPCAASPG